MSQYPMPQRERTNLDQAVVDVAEARRSLGRTIIALRQVPGVLAESTRLKKDLADVQDVERRLLNHQYHDDRHRREAAAAAKAESGERNAEASR